MKPPPPRPLIDVDEALRLRNEERLSAVEIARRLGFTAQAVRRAIRRHGGSLLPGRSHRTVPHGRRLYSLWLSLRARCSSPSHPLFPRYGGRGIRVGAAWRTFWPFYDWALAAGYRPRLNVELVGRARTFSPATCRFITMRQRMERDGFPHGARARRWITAFGETRSAAEWASDPRCNVTQEALRVRIRKGVPPEAAITLPPDRGTLLRVDPRRTIPNSGPRKLLDWKEIVRLYREEDLTVQGSRVAATRATTACGRA